MGVELVDGQLNINLGDLTLEDSEHYQVKFRFTTNSIKTVEKLEDLKEQFLQIPSKKKNKREKISMEIEYLEKKIRRRNAANTWFFSFGEYSEAINPKHGAPAVISLSASKLSTTNTHFKNRLITSAVEGLSYMLILRLQ